MSFAVEIKNLNKEIKGKKIINDLSFNARRGEILGFLGPNGAGKTTTIRMVVGLIRMTSGDVLIDGKSIKTNKIEALKKIGAIVENPELYPYMTGRQNLEYFAKMYKDIGEKEILEATRLVKLENALNQKVGTYSLGMRQRLGIAVSLLHKPEILILDEPTNGLDPAGIKEMRGYLKELAHKQNLAIIVSSHLLSEIELMCDRVVIMQKGEFVREIDLRNKSIGNNYVLLEVDDINKAKAIIEGQVQLSEVAIDGKSNNSGYEVSIEDEILKVNLEKEDIPKIVRKLVLNNIDIYKVSSKEETLEDIFLNSTGGTVYGR